MRCVEGGRVGLVMLNEKVSAKDLVVRALDPLRTLG